MSSVRPLSQGNRLQRAYARWAAPHYARMAPDLAAQAQWVDNVLYSRRGLGLWLGMLAAVGASAAGLVRAGMPFALALVLALVLWAALGLGLLSAWLQPQHYVWSKLRRWLLPLAVIGILPGLAGYLVGRAARVGWDPDVLLPALWRGLDGLAPVYLATFGGVMLLIGGVALMRRQWLERELEKARATQAQLQLLQRQIEPHFVFNTLAALQHWVDQGDPRAAPLLRALTGFLRGSSQALARPVLPLADELALVRHYLHIVQARLGERARSEVQADDSASAQQLPAGVLLTLVENAVVHGLEPALGGGVLWVRASGESTGLRLVVENSGQPLRDDWHEGIGLANTRQRLAHHGGPAATLTLRARDGGGCVAEAFIPQPLRHAGERPASCT